MIDTKLKRSVTFLYDTNNNKKKALIPIKTFEAFIGQLEDLHDITLAKKRSAKSEKTYTLKEVASLLNKRQTK
jgi:hypothetical protein